MYSLAKKLREDVMRANKNGKGLGATLRHLQRMKKNQDSTTIGLFRFTIKTLHREGIKFSNKQIRYHFNKFVDIDDYDKKIKGEILKDLYDP